MQQSLWVSMVLHGYAICAMTTTGSVSSTIESQHAHPGLGLGLVVSTSAYGLHGYIVASSLQYMVM